MLSTNVFFWTVPNGCLLVNSPQAILSPTELVYALTTTVYRLSFIKSMYVCARSEIKYSYSYSYIPLNTVIYHWILLYTAAYCYIPLHTVIYRWILLYTAENCYIPLNTVIYRRILLHTAEYCYTPLARHRIGKSSESVNGAGQRSSYFLNSKTCGKFNHHNRSMTIAVPIQSVIFENVVIN